MSVAFDTGDRGMHVPADEKTLIAVFGLSPMEARFLQALLQGDWVGKEEMPEVAFSIRQVIYLLRKKLEQKLIGRNRIWIINDGQGRYSITLTGKLALSVALEQYLKSVG